MASDHSVVYGQGDQTIRFVPRDRSGKVVVVASAVYAVEDLRLSESDANRFVVSAAAASVDAVSTTTTAIAGRGSSDPRLISLTDTTGIVSGRTYLLTASDGRREPVEVSEVGASSIRTKDEVAGTYASASTFVGCEITGTFPSAEANDESAFDDGGGPYLGTWSYTVDGVSETFRVPFFVTISRETCPATEQDLLLAEPLVQSLGGGRTPLSQYLEAAWWTFRAKARAAGLDLASVHVGEVGTAAIAHWAAAKILRTHDVDGYAELALANENQAQSYFDALLTGKDPIGVVRVDPHEDQSPSGYSEFYRPRWLAR